MALLPRAAMSRDGVRLTRAVLLAGVCHGFELSRTVTDPLSSGDRIGGNMQDQWLLTPGLTLDK